MGASASRIWTDICAIESDDVRARMIGTVFQSPELIVAAQQAGLYTTVASWLAGYRAGLRSPFPYATNRQDTIQHDSPRWSMYTTPVGPQQTHRQQPAQQPQYTAYQETAVIVSPAAKALDYFQESLQLLGIREDEELTADRLKRGYKQAAMRAHPDKGGSKEAFDEVARAYKYVEKILGRIAGPSTKAEKARMSAAVTMENARTVRETAAAEFALPDQPPVQLSAKKLDMSMFNKLFEENRLPDPSRDSGYGDWLKGQGGSDDVAADPRLKGKFSQDLFESVFREKASQQTAGTAIMRRLEPDALIATGGTELGGDTSNFTAAFGSDTQFTDLKEAYTTGATRFQEVADVRVVERSARSVNEAEAMRAREMARVDPDESSRIAAAAAALEERERQRRMRLAQQDMSQEAWANAMKRRLLVNN